MDDSFVVPFPPVESFSPEEFEEATAAFLSPKMHLGTNFQVQRSVNLTGTDGSYEIDVLVTFQHLGADFKMLVECKKQGRPVERDVVQVLLSRIQSTGSHKGMIFSTAGFQAGAIKFATIHGIALIRICHGHAVYETRSLEGAKRAPDWLTQFVGHSYSVNNNGVISCRLIEPCDDWLTGLLQGTPD